MKKIISVCVAISALAFVNTFASEKKSGYEVSPEVIERVLSSQNVSFARMTREAREGLSRVNRKISLRERGKKVREYIREGDRLYAEGSKEEAEAKWAEALDLSENPQDVRMHIQQFKKLYYKR